MTDFRPGLPSGYCLANRYQIERELGRGGFGITYMALDIEMGRRLAIKEYFPADHATRDGALTIRSVQDPVAGFFAAGRSQFRKECQTLARIDHENVVPVFHSFDANNTAYILMPYLEGQRLRDWRLRAGRPSQDEIERIARGMLDGLAAVHATGLLHRDISPDNILLDTETLRPTIIDFGASRQAASVYTRSFVRTVKDGYSPPELYVTLPSSQNDEGPWCDIYSLGATLYFLVTGLTPEPAPLRQTSAETPLVLLPEAAGYRPELIAAIDRAMSLRWQERFATVEDFQKALVAPPALQSAPGVATSAGSEKYLTFTELQKAHPPQPIQAPRRRLAPWLGATAAALVIVAGGMMVFGNPLRTQATDTPAARTALADAAAMLAAEKQKVSDAQAAAHAANQARERAEQIAREAQRRADERSAAEGLAIEAKRADERQRENARHAAAEQQLQNALKQAQQKAQAQQQGERDAARITFKQLPSQFVEGEGFRTDRGGNTDNCEQLCRETSACKLYEFYKPDKKCNLFDKVLKTGPSKEANVGIKQFTDTPVAGFVKHADPITTGSLRPPPGSHAVQVGAFADKAGAEKHLKAVTSLAGAVVTSSRAFASPVDRDGTTLWRAQFRGFDEASADAACKALKEQEIDCFTAKAE